MAQRIRYRTDHSRFWPIIKPQYSSRGPRALNITRGIILIISSLHHRAQYLRLLQYSWKLQLCSIRVAARDCMLSRPLFSPISDVALYTVLSFPSHSFDASHYVKPGSRSVLRRSYEARLDLRYYQNPASHSTQRYGR